jgi:hypothetical protein
MLKSGGHITHSNNALEGAAFPEHAIAWVGKSEKESHILVAI